MAAGEFEFFFNRHRRDAILLHRPYPPHHARRTNSKFGGLPRLPSEVEWPRTLSGAPLHFFAQIDCADLPHPSILPERGVLFFFGRDDEEQVWDLERPPADACAVVHALDASAATPLRQLPPDIPPIGGTFAPHRAWRDTLLEGEEGPSSHVEWPIELLPMDSFPEAFDQESGVPGPTSWHARLARIFAPPPTPSWQAEEERHRRYAEALAQRRADAFSRATGIARPDLASTVGQDRTAARAIFFNTESGATAYPQHWLTIRYAARILLRQLTVYPYADVDLVARLPREAEAWLARAAAIDLDASVDEQDRADFREWLRALRMAGDEAPLSDEAGRLVFMSMVATIRCWAGDSDRAARVAPAVYEAMAFYFSPFNLWGLQASQMLGHAPTVQEPVHPAEPIVCLLNLASEQALGWQWGDVGYCSFWIDTADLVTSDFSRVWGTIEGG